jgi:hypothetical protein
MQKQEADALESFAVHWVAVVLGEKALPAEGHAQTAQLEFAILTFIASVCMHCA